MRKRLNSLNLEEDKKLNEQLLKSLLLYIITKNLIKILIKMKWTIWNSKVNCWCSEGKNLIRAFWLSKNSWQNMFTKMMNVIIMTLLSRDKILSMKKKIKKRRKERNWIGHKFQAYLIWEILRNGSSLLSIEHRQIIIRVGQRREISGRGIDYLL